MEQTLQVDEASSSADMPAQSDAQNGLQVSYTQLNSKQRKRLASSSPLAPIWTVQAEPIFFEAERPAAKELAKAFTAA